MIYSILFCFSFEVQIAATVLASQLIDGHDPESESVVEKCITWRAVAVDAVQCSVEDCK